MKIPLNIDATLENFDKCPSEMKAQRIEALTGLVADWSDGDWGTGERQHRSYPQVESSSDEPY